VWHRRTLALIALRNRPRETALRKSFPFGYHLRVRRRSPFLVAGLATFLAGVLATGLAACGSFRAAADDVAPDASGGTEDASDARWVTPSLVGEVTYADWVEGSDGASGERRMRHSVWRGWRPEKATADVVVESAGDA